MVGNSCSICGGRKNKQKKEEEGTRLGSDVGESSRRRVGHALTTNCFYDSSGNCVLQHEEER